jgi:type I restriction enzyme S subunit
MTNKLQKYPAYKDSGVEWLGEIPEHWEVKKVTHIFNKIGSGTTPTAGMLKYYENGSINWLQTGDLNDSVISETSKKITKKAISDFTTLRHYPIDSIVIAMYGATIGKLGF